MNQVMKLSQARQINKSRELGMLLNSSLLQRRILYSCIAVMNPVIPHLDGFSYDQVRDWMDENGKEARKLRTHLIDLKDFAEVWGMRGNSLAENLNVAIGYDPKTGSSPEIMKLCFKYINKKGDLDFINVISRVKIDSQKGIISIVLTDDILPFFINLASYTSIPFKATIGFKSNYSFAMLEYLISKYSSSNPTKTYKKVIGIETLHIILGTENTASYKIWTRFKERVLDRITTDFSLIVNEGYDIQFKPIYESFGRGRPKVTKVEVTFNFVGFNRFKKEQKDRQDGLKHLEDLGQIAGRARDARAKYNLEKQKEKDKKDSKEVLLSDKKAEKQLSLADLPNDDDFDWNDENLPF